MGTNKNNYNERGELISYELYDVFDDPSPFPHKKSRISPERFAAEYKSFVGKYPFKPEYIGVVNPYTKKKVETKEDYYQYLREHCYLHICDSYVDCERYKTDTYVREANTKLNRAQSRIESLEKELSESERKYAAVNDRNASLQAMLRRSFLTVKRTRRYFGLFVSVLLIVFLFASSGNPSIALPPARSYEAGYAAGLSDQAAADAAGKQDEYQAGFSEGYASGREDWYGIGKQDGYQSGFIAGKDKGYNEGYYKGYWEGYADAGERSTGSGDSHGESSGQHTSTGSSRDTPIADTYIGNTKTKKFHLPSCSYLPDQNHQETFDSRDEAIAAGYTPCGHCKP